MTEAKQCVAKYGDKRCTNNATELVFNGMEAYQLCKDCAKLTKKQIKQNSQ